METEFTQVPGRAGGGVIHGNSPQRHCENPIDGRPQVATTQGPTMDDTTYPALYRSADGASNDTQAFHLNLIRADYALLFLAAVFSTNLFSNPIFYLIYALVFATLIAVLLTRSLKKPEQEWYRARALAESVKTLTWRYMMRAAPFGDA